MNLYGTLSSTVYFVVPIAQKYGNQHKTTMEKNIFQYFEKYLIIFKYKNLIYILIINYDIFYISDRKT